MEQNTKPLTLEEAATNYAKMLFPGGGPNYVKAKEDFEAGGKWQKEQNNKLLQRCLTFMADLNGSEWIAGNNAGSLDMKQRAKAIQSLLYQSV